MEKTAQERVRVTNSRYDITGQELSRIGKHYLISKFSKYEAFGGGPGLKNILIMYVVQFVVKKYPDINLTRLGNIYRKIFRRF